MEKKTALCFGLNPKFCPLPLPLPSTSPRLAHHDDNDNDNDNDEPPYIPTHAPLTLHSLPTHRAAQSEINTHYLTALDDPNRMPGLHWPFVLAPLPPRRKKPVQPGFTAEELLYLKEVLAVVRPLLPYTHAPVHISHPLD